MKKLFQRQIGFKYVSRFYLWILSGQVNSFIMYMYLLIEAFIH